MRIRKLAVLLVALVAALVWLAPRAIAEFEPGVAYVSGLEVGKGKTALLRIANNSPSRVTYDLSYTAFADDGNVVAVFAGVVVVFDETVEIDIGQAINAYRQRLNPNAAGYAGNVKLLIQGGGGFGINPFGRHTVAVEGIQKIRKASYQAAVTWREIQ